MKKHINMASRVTVLAALILTSTLLTLTGTHTAHAQDYDYYDAKAQYDTSLAQYEQARTLNKATSEQYNNLKNQYDTLKTQWDTKKKAYDAYLSDVEKTDAIIHRMEAQFGPLYIQIEDPTTPTPTNHQTGKRYSVDLVFTPAHDLSNPSKFGSEVYDAIHSRGYTTVIWGGAQQVDILHNLNNFDMNACRTALSTIPQATTDKQYNTNTNTAVVQACPSLYSQVLKADLPGDMPVAPTALATQTPQPAHTTVPGNSPAQPQARPQQQLATTGTAISMFIAVALITLLGGVTVTWIMRKKQTHIHA